MLFKLFVCVHGKRTYFIFLLYVFNNKKKIPRNFLRFQIYYVSLKGEKTKSNNIKI